MKRRRSSDIQEPLDTTPIPIPNTHITEITLDIFKFLNRDVIEKCQMVSHQWNSLVLGCAQVLPLRSCSSIKLMDITVYGHNKWDQSDKLYREKVKKGEISSDIKFQDFMREILDETNITVEFTCESKRPFQISLKDLEQLNSNRDPIHASYHHIRYLKHCIFYQLTHGKNYFCDGNRRREYLLSIFLQILFYFNEENLHVKWICSNDGLKLISPHVDLKRYIINLSYRYDVCAEFLSEPTRWKIPNNVEKIQVFMTENMLLEWLSDTNFLTFIQGQELCYSSSFAVEFELFSGEYHEPVSKSDSEKFEEIRQFITKLIQIFTTSKHSETFIKHYNIKVETEIEEEEPKDYELFKEKVPDFFYLPKYRNCKCSKEIVEDTSFDNYDEKRVEKETVVIPIQGKWQVKIVMNKTWRSRDIENFDTIVKIYLFFEIIFVKL